MISSETALPDFKDWSIAAVRLLQGVIYSDDGSEWGITLSNQSMLETYFGRLGLLLVVDETDGLAYLRQAEEQEQSAGYERVPRLFRRSRLGYEDTLLCILLREELRRFEDEEIQQERCVIRSSELFEQWKAFFGGGQDEVRLKRALDAALRGLEVMKFVRLFGTEPEEWEIRRILKARMPVAKLESLLATMKLAHETRSDLEKTDGSDA